MVVDRMLLLHWNEISIPTDAAPGDLEGNPVWAELARSAFESFFLAQKADPPTSHTMRA
jgi:hypothetical protein